jgi:hypothetical protein
VEPASVELGDVRRVVTLSMAPELRWMRSPLDNDLVPDSPYPSPRSIEDDIGKPAICLLALRSENHLTGVCPLTYPPQFALAWHLYQSDRSPTPSSYDNPEAQPCGHGFAFKITEFRLNRIRSSPRAAALPRTLRVR